MKLPDRISINTKSKTIRVCYGGRHGEQAYFPVSKYGSYQFAMAAALDYETSLPKIIRRGRRKPRENPNENSTSGIVGVHPLHNRSYEKVGWRASWIDYSEDLDGIRKTKDYSYHSWGSNAFNKACQCREEMIELNQKCLDSLLRDESNDR